MKKIDKGQLINLSILFLSLIVSIWLLNRAFIVGSVTGILFLLFAHHKMAWTKKQSFITGIILTLLILALTLFIKNDSSLGRLFIYKISWQIFCKNWLNGIGLGNFQLEYGLYQASYFAQGDFLIKEFLLADNVFFAFNDYWQFILETGLIGICILLISVLTISKLVIDKLRDSENRNINRLLISILIVIASAAFFTHVFENKIFQLFLLVIISWLVLTNDKLCLTSSYRNILLSVVVIACLTFQYANYFSNFNSYRKFKDARALALVGYHLESLKLYKEAYPYLRDDIYFLKCYAEELFYIKEKHEALQIYGALSLKRTELEVYLKLGEIEESITNYERAERFYLAAKNLVPNRFGTRIMLFNLYINTRQFQKAKQLGQETLNMPVKIPSLKVNLLKQDIVKKMLLLKNVKK